MTILRAFYIIRHVILCKVGSRALSVAKRDVVCKRKVFNLRCASASVATVVRTKKRAFSCDFRRFAFCKALFFLAFMNFLFSDFLKKLSASKKIAFISLFTAISTLSNMFLEARVFDVQYSLTIAFSFYNGIILGPLFGFVSCFLGDLIGYFINNWGQLYMPWVGISTGTFAFISGIVFHFKSDKATAMFLKLAIFTVTSFIICTVAINSTGFYFYNRKMGFSDAVLSYAESLTGKRQTSYFIYLLYRLIFKGQIFNSLFNYAILFVTLPLFKKIPYLNVN